MNINIDVRKKQLESLSHYIKSSKDNVQTILKRLGWTAKKVLENGEEKVKCPLNGAHTTTIENAPKHIEKCNMKCAGYDLTENFLSEPTNHPSMSITLDNPKKVEILNKAKQASSKFRPERNAYGWGRVISWNGHSPDPMTVDRLTSTYSPDERLALYNYCVKNTAGPSVPPEINFEDKISKDENLTYEQLLEKIRDSKRRRVKYKSVHTSRKTYTELMREVIDNQMELYKEWSAKQCAKSVEKAAEGDRLLIEDYDRCVQNLENVQNYYGDVPDYFGDVPTREQPEGGGRPSGPPPEPDGGYDRKVEEFLSRTAAGSSRSGPPSGSGRRPGEGPKRGGGRYRRVGGPLDRDRRDRRDARSRHGRRN